MPIISRLSAWFTIVILTLAAWGVLFLAIGNPLILPGPGAVWHAASANMTKLLFNITVTIGEALVGLSIAIVASALLIVLLSLSKFLRYLVYTWGVFVKAAPAVAYAPIVAGLVGTGFLANSLISSMICFFPLLNGGLDGASTTPDKLGLFARIYAARGIARLRRIELGYTLSGFSSGLKIATPLSVVGAIVGEYVAGGSSTGIGSFIFTCYLDLKFAEMLSGVLFATLAGLGMFILAAQIHRSVVGQLNLVK